MTVPHKPVIKMKKHILERYRRDNTGQLVVDIAATKVSDLYDDFDKHAPFVKKELDYDLVEYLIDSVREVRNEPFSVNFTFSEETPPPLESRVRKSIHNYFGYLLETNKRELMRMFRSSAILLGHARGVHLPQPQLRPRRCRHRGGHGGGTGYCGMGFRVGRARRATDELAAFASHQARLRPAFKRSLFVQLQSRTDNLRIKLNKRD